MFVRTILLSVMMCSGIFAGMFLAEEMFVEHPLYAAEAKTETTSKIDINSADSETLQTIKGIGIKLAERIIAKRPYKKLEDLLNIKGIGEKKFDKIKSSLTVSQPEEDSETEKK